MPHSTPTARRRRSCDSSPVERGRRGRARRCASTIRDIAASSTSCRSRTRRRDAHDWFAITRRGVARRRRRPRSDPRRRHRGSRPAALRRALPAASSTRAAPRSATGSPRTPAAAASRRPRPRARRALGVRDACRSSRASSCAPTSRTPRRTASPRRPASRARACSARSATTQPRKARRLRRCGRSCARSSERRRESPPVDARARDRPLPGERLVRRRDPPRLPRRPASTSRAGSTARSPSSTTSACAELAEYASELGRATLRSLAPASIARRPRRRPLVPALHARARARARAAARAAPPAAAAGSADARPRSRSCSRALEGDGAARAPKPRARRARLLGRAAQREAVGLDLADVDFEQELVHVRGKGGKERVVPLGEEAALLARALSRATRAPAARTRRRERALPLRPRAAARHEHAAPDLAASAPAAARVRDAPARGRRRPAHDPGAARPFALSRRRRSTATSTASACAASTTRRTRGRRAADPRARSDRSRASSRCSRRGARRGRSTPTGATSPHLTAFLGGSPASATTDDLERYLAELRAAGLAPATIARRTAALRSFYRHQQLLGARDGQPGRRARPAAAPPRSCRARSRPARPSG